MLCKKKKKENGKSNCSLVNLLCKPKYCVHIKKGNMYIISTHCYAARLAFVQQQTVPVRTKKHAPVRITANVSVKTTPRLTPRKNTMRRHESCTPNRILQNSVLTVLGDSGHAKFRRKHKQLCRQIPENRKMAINK